MCISFRCSWLPVEVVGSVNGAPHPRLVSSMTSTYVVGYPDRHCGGVRLGVGGAVGHPSAASQRPLHPGPVGPQCRWHSGVPLMPPDPVQSMPGQVVVVGPAVALGRGATRMRKTMGSWMRHGRLGTPLPCPDGPSCEGCTMHGGCSRALLRGLLRKMYGAYSPLRGRFVSIGCAQCDQRQRW